MQVIQAVETLEMTSDQPMGSITTSEYWYYSPDEESYSRILSFFVRPSGGGGTLRISPGKFHQGIGTFVTMASVLLIVVEEDENMFAAV